MGDILSMGALSQQGPSGAMPKGENLGLSSLVKGTKEVTPGGVLPQKSPGKNDQVNTQGNAPAYSRRRNALYGGGVNNVNGGNSYSGTTKSLGRENTIQQ